MGRPIVVCWVLAGLVMASCAVSAESLDALIAGVAADEAGSGDQARKGSEEADVEVVVLDEAEVPDAQGTPARRATMLEEIIVTAQKREQGLSEVPLSVTALSGEKLDQAGIENLIDLSEYAPNFKMVNDGLVPLLFMRGVGSGSNQGFEMSVGMYSDDIHLGRPFQTFAAFLDVERIEVLKGPQSILFGKNAIAGALNISSARPQDAFGSRLGASWYEPDGDGEVDAYVTGPLGETLKGRLAGRYRTEGGYLTNLSQQRKEPQLDEADWRGSLVWTPGAALDVLLKLEHTDRRQRGRTFQVVERGILNESNDSELGFDAVRDTDVREYARLESDAIVAHAHWQLPGGHDLKLVSGYSRYSFRDILDADASNLDSALVDGLEDYAQFSQEVRWMAAPGRYFDFIGGMFYQQSTQAFEELLALNVRSGTVEFVAVPADLIDPVAMAGPAHLQVVASGDVYRLFNSDNDAWSLFGQATIPLRASTRLNLGLRFVNERKAGRRLLRLYESGTQDPMNPASRQVFSQLKVEEHQLAGSRSVNNILPSLSIQHDLNETLMLYASASRGAKSGGYDARNNNARSGEPAAGADFFEYQDEIADAFELGGKMRFPDHALEVNSALYWVDYQDMQISVFDGVAGFAVSNAGEARVRGLEVDARYLASSGLMLTAAVALLDFEWLRYREGRCHFGREEDENGYCDLSGETNMQAPRWTLSLGSHYATTLMGLKLALGLDLNFRDEHHSGTDLDPRGIQAAAYKINSRIALSDPQERWSLALVGKNLNDVRTTGGGAPIPLDTGGYMKTTERPRSIGLELRYLMF